MRILFPTNTDVLSKFPNLNGVFKRAARQAYSSKQIFHLLDNLHMPHIQKLASFLESILNEKEHFEFIKAKLNSPDSLQFSNDLSELFLLSFLLKNGYKVKPFDVVKSQLSVPEFHVHKNSDEFLIELYSPVELYGYEAFFHDLRDSLKYLDVEYGFNLKKRVLNRRVNTPFDPTSFYYPYEIYSKYVNDNVRRSKIADIIKTFANHAQERADKFEVQITENVSLKFEFELFKEKGARSITTIGATHSVSTSTYFELAPCTAKGFYQKVFKKIKEDQLNQKEHPSTIKIFLIDFSHTQDGYSLINEMGEGYHSQKFYENLSRCLESEIKNSTIHLIYPIISGIDSDFIVGKCVYNSKGISSPFNH